MTLDAFKRAISEPSPPAGHGSILQAMWWAAKGDWNRAHELVQGESGRDAAWIHAYLHRVEGDLDNAGYWYRQARRAKATGSLATEWTAIASALLESKQR